MNTVVQIALVIAAAGLGACPFSVWIGHWLLNKDIRDYGDGNPGAWNVFRAGGRMVGWFALALDVVKGVPFVVLASSCFDLSTSAVFLVGISAILGHAYSPFLHFRGGKAVAVTYGVIAALPKHEILLLMAIFMFLGFLLCEVHAWVIVLGPVGSLAFLGISGSTGVELFFLSSVLVVFVAKNYPDLKTLPGHKGKLFMWFQAVRR